MFSKNMQVIYKRLMILGLLSMCLFVFGYTNETQNAAASAACIQDCEASERTCDDSCMTACSISDEDCNSCIGSCDTQFERCMRFAVSCANSGPYENSRCQVGYAAHCPIIHGTVSCDPDDGAHNGYYEICNTIGGNQCVSCPDGERCVGANGLPPCF